MAPVEASLSASRSSLEGGEARVRREGVRVGYLTSMYPAVSHTFIRREIAALEGLGYDIDRYSIRESSPSDLIDEQDVR